MEQHLGRKIKKLRELRNFTQNYMAEQLGITQPTYSKLEKEEDDLDEDRLTKIAEILGITVSDIYNFDDRLILQITNNHGEDGYVHIKYSDSKVIKLLEKQNKLLEEKVEYLEKELLRTQQENELLKAKVR